ncbi:hypothetical protein [Bosea sp. AAP35]|nr:hypothetical protein [Bosea sp. AAP35]
MLASIAAPDTAFTFGPAAAPSTLSFGGCGVLGTAKEALPTGG